VVCQAQRTTVCGTQRLDSYGVVDVDEEGICRRVVLNLFDDSSLVI